MYKVAYVTLYVTIYKCICMYYKHRMSSRKSKPDKISEK